jgi:hypothetical protein
VRRYLARSTAGGFQVPSRISCLGQYRRMIRLNSSPGAGSQFDSLPGDSCLSRAHGVVSLMGEAGRGPLPGPLGQRLRYFFSSIVTLRILPVNLLSRSL